MDCSQGITWSIDNKYYKAEVAVEVREGAGEGEEWEAIITLCNLTKVVRVRVCRVNETLTEKDV